VKNQITASQTVVTFYAAAAGAAGYDAADDWYGVMPAHLIYTC